MTTSTLITGIMYWQMNLQVPSFEASGEEWIKCLMADRDKYPGVVKFWYGPFLPTVDVYHPRTVSVLLRSSGTTYNSPNTAISTCIDHAIVVYNCRDYRMFNFQ